MEKLRPARTLSMRAVLAITMLLSWLAPAAPALAQACGGNAIACENQLAGNPISEWGISGSGDPSIQGFAMDISYNVGQTVTFKVSTPATAYHLDIYRLGYYQGNGARKVATVNPSASLPQTQPACLTDAPTGLIDCGNWAPSASWTVPSTAVSGLYIARLVRPDTGGASHIAFIVRNDASHSDILYQASDTTWQAYNNYGGNSLYVGGPGTNPGRAYKVSYNRPFVTRTSQNGLGDLSWVFGEEYPMLRWLESNGYDVTYSTDTDTDRHGSLITQHKVFLSVGHDEYWSAAQRANVEAARDAGVNLAFLSGNEMFWKTRWENSIDGSNTSYRTLVSYKETHANAVIDPKDPPTWTGTWRDPRFSPPGDGGRPENALSGTIFMINCCVFQPITVPAADGKMRIWRNTSVANLANGQVATLSDSVLGNEFDEDVDNGFRPAGAFQLSTTNVSNVNYLQDFGTTYAAGDATHHMMMYRAASGALVFSAGTILWAWGLDGSHDHQASLVDVNLQQATLNVLADMGAQATTIQPGLVAATASADHTAPHSTITSPSAGAVLADDQQVTISGTATDTGGGVVGGVEVSVDGGTTWHPASGRASWSYTYSPTTPGATAIKTRAVDDSGNLETPSAGVNVTVAAPVCPCTIWPDATTPTTASASDTNPYELGLRFQSDTAGYITGIRFYKGQNNTGTHVGNLWTAGGTLLQSAAFSGETDSGWQQVTFSTPVQINANTTYIASYRDPNGGYSVDNNYFVSSGVNNAPLHALSNAAAGGNGVFANGANSPFPNQSFNASNYWVEPVFSTNPTPPAPTISNISVTGVSSTGATITWTTNVPTSSQVFYGTTASYGSQTTLDTSLVTSHSQAISGLQPGTTYHYQVQSKDASNNVVTSTDQTLTTAAPPSCPCSIWPASTVPATTSSSDAGAYELGVRFQSDTAGYISGIRFYKGANNTGTHVGNLWTSTGTLLQSATFTGETASGWQQVNFAAPVAISANTTYVASYRDPNGGYAVNTNYFTLSGVDSSPLHALSSPVAEGNGVFGVGGNSPFPNQSFNASNYWVDVVFSTSPPALAVSNIAAGNISSTGATVTWTTTVPATSQVFYGPTSSYGSQTTLDTTLTANHSQALSGLQANTTYHYKLQSKDASNNTVSSGDQTFTTAAPASCPCSIWPNTATPATVSSPDTGAYELGLRFQSDTAGYVTGIRFYKGANNTGTHVGNLWTSTGTLLQSATFTGETSTGWQQVSFSTPVQVTANTTYVASYRDPNGGYAVNTNYFTSSGVDNSPLHALSSPMASGNGVFASGANSPFPNQSFNASNYWVDVVFTTAPPALSISNIDSSNISSTGATITWSTSVPASSQVFYGTTTSYGSQTTLDSNSVTSHSQTLSGLQAGTTYHYKVQSKDASNNTVNSADETFTTAAAPACPCTIWPATATPSTTTSPDTNPYELGVRFRSDTAGYIKGIRFYKGIGNTGAHVGNLWSASGTLLATATFTGETASGWQQVLFSTPVAITANTTYVASYRDPNGGYSVDNGYFASTGVDRSPLHALSSPAAGGNGVFATGANSPFPNQSFNGSNYWVDVVFSLTP